MIQIAKGARPLMLCALLALSGTAHALTQTQSPATCTSVVGIGTVAWTNPARAVSTNNSYATASVDGTTTRYLQCVDYGFSIPAGSTIDGITVRVERRSSSTSNGGSHDAAMRIVKTGAIGTADRSTGTTYTTADVYESHGGASDLWGTAWTAADINAANFGAAFAATKASSSGGAHTISVDHIEIIVDYTPFPTVSSINRASADPTTPNTSVAWTVVFSSSVTGVNAPDFALAQAGGVSGASITSVTGSGTTWTVTANTGTGTAGTLGLNLIDDDSIVDSSSRPLGGAGAGNGNFTGQVYTLAPTVISIDRASSNPTSAGVSVSWTVTFSASVTGVNAADFALVQIGGVAGASITSVTGSGTTWTVTANTGTGVVGTLGLNLVDDDSIVDAGSRRLGGTGAGNGNFTGQTYTLVLVVLSINRAGSSPAEAGTTVAWTVVFSGSVTGVDAADFALVPAGGATGVSITSVTGGGTTWTVSANSGTSAGTLGLNLVDDDSIVSGGNRLGGTGAGNGNFTGQVYTLSPPFCAPPSNIPAGVTVDCVCDRFGRASLNPSTIYGANWIVSKSDSTAIVPYINATTGNLRLTENTGNNAKAATVPGIFPAAGNYISVEFQHFSYGGSGADGIAVTLSDYAVTAVPGAFGGSLGYAQKTGAACPTLPGVPCPGFAGGWVGVGVDEFGNFQNPTEGRIGGPGSRVDSVGVRGSGAGVNGYNWVGGTNTLSPGIDNTGSATPAPGHYYQVIVDARNDPASTSVMVNRDTGSGYASLVSIPNIYTAATAQGFTQSPVPDNWQISFTGSTGGSTNVHEIGGLRVCAQTVAPPSGGTASGFNAIDEAYGTPPSGPPVQSFLTGHLYMKLLGVPFRLNVAALDDNQILTTYAAGGSKNVAVKLVNNTDGVCVLDSTQPNYCNAACAAKVAVAGGSQTMTFVAGDAGKKLSANFTLNTAYRNLIAIMSDATTTACSTDAFSVRPGGVTSVTSSNATNAATSGTPTFKAGADQFSLTATTAGIAGNPSGYTGVLKINSAASANAVQAVSPAVTAGTISPSTFPGATSATPSSTATGTTFTYSEVGAFRLRGYDPTTNSSAPRGVYDGVNTATECAAPMSPAMCDGLRGATWVGIDSITSKGDCVQNNYSNVKDVNGKYGCSFGLLADSAGFGRFTPAYFDLVYTHACAAGGFTYSGQPFNTVVVTPYEASGGTINNYRSTYGLAKDVTISNAGNPANFSDNVLSGATAFNGPNGSSNSVTYTFPSKETAPLVLTLRASDADGVSSVGHETAANNAEVRSGRLLLQNIFGSELLPMSMPLRAQHYSGGGFITNPQDMCTAIGVGTLSLSNAGGTVAGPGPIGVSGGATSASIASNPMAAGDSGLSFTAPGAGHGGYVDVRVDLSPAGLNIPWLQFNWDGIDQGGDGKLNDDSPSGRITFGVNRGSPRNIHLREQF